MQSLTTVEWVAGRLGVPRWRVYEMVRAGQIPAVRLGRAVKFDIDRIEAWIAAGGTASAETDRAA